MEPIIGVQLRDSDGLGILSQENPDEDLQDSALKPDPNELAGELAHVALIYRIRPGTDGDYQATILLDREKSETPTMHRTTGGRDAKRK